MTRRRKDAALFIFIGMISSIGSIGLIFLQYRDDHFVNPAT